MKMHPFLVIGVVVVSAVAGYYLRSSFPAPGTPVPDDEMIAASETIAQSETPQPRPSLAAIEAENEIRRAVEEREEEWAETPADDQPASLKRQPMLVEKFSAAPFYDELAPYGEWLQADDYGDVWQPEFARASEWRPYIDGGWAFTEAGWTWDSDEPGGDITCHYGRWVNLAECGWCWVPGNDWAPAWVSWRCSDEVIGWAPLPPCVPWRPAAGLGPWVDACGDLGPGSYCFVPIRHFAAANCRPVLCARAQSTEHFCRTRNLTRLVCKPDADGRSHPVLDGPDVQRIAALSPKDLRRRHLQWVEASGPRPVKGSNLDVLAVRRLAFSAAAGASERSPKALRRLDHVTIASPWKGAGDAQMLATARRQVFAEAHETFRGLPRLMPPVGAAKSNAPRHQGKEVKIAQVPAVESLRPQPASTRPARGVSLASHDVAVVARLGGRAQIPEASRSTGKESATSLAGPRPAREPGRASSPTPTAVPQTRGPALAVAHLEPAALPIVPQRLEPAPSLAPRQATAERPIGRGAQRLAAQAAREREARETQLEQRAAEAQAVEYQRGQDKRLLMVQEQQEQLAQQEQQRHALVAQQEKDERQRRASEQRSHQARNQAMAEQQQHQAEAERQAMAERQREQVQARQQQEIERRQQIEQAHQQAMLQARRQEEAQQREQIEQSRRQAEMQARQMAAEQRQRDNEARQQQAEAQRRQADENQRRQQMQEAQERAHAARQQQMEQARQQQQEEANRQRTQEAARQQGGHSQEKRGR